MRSILFAATITAGVLVAANPAQAQDSGFRVTALGGLERTDSGPGAGAEDGAYYGVQLGKDWQLGAVQIGVEGELGDSTASGSYLGDPARQGLFAGAALRLAVPVTPTTQVFARGGYAYHKIDYATRPDFSGSGYTLGGGIEQDLGGPLFLRGEYRFSDYGSQVRGQHFIAGIGLRF